MTLREQIITRDILDFLHSLDGGQATELEIHAAICKLPAGIRPPPSGAETAAALANCSAQQWITGVPSRFKGKMKWNINDAGEAVRLELQ